MGTIWSAMSTIVGAWRTTKKIGRDDEAIERDRMEAVARRKELNRRGPRKSNVKRSLFITGQTNKRRSEENSASWVKHPCEKPKRRSYRVREPISPQRELFPKKRKKRLSSNDDPWISKEPTGQSSHQHCRLCELCGGKITKSIKENHNPSKTLFDLSPSPEQIFRRKRYRSRKRSRTVVTPEQECGERQSPSELRTRVYRSRRRRLNVRALPFSDEKVASTSRIAKTQISIQTNQDGRRYKPTDTRCRYAKRSKRRKLQRDSVAMNRLGHLPDFARSAKYFYEFIRRPNKSTQQKSNKKIVGENIDKDTETQFEPVKSLLIGTNKEDSIRNSISGSSETKIQSRKDDTRKPHDSTSETTVAADATIFDFSTYKSAKEIVIQSQWVERKGVKNNAIGSSGIEGKQRMLTQQQSDRSIEEKQNIFKRSPFAKKSRSTSGSLNAEKNIDYFTQEEEIRENASPSQTPSTAPSAMLSLPTNYPFTGLTLPSFEDSQRSNRKLNDSNFSRLNTTPSNGGFVSNITKRKEDPLRDIGFWQRILEREETKMKNKSHSKSFKHTIASLVLAKNSTSCDNRANRDSEGFLWLPSILEGGLANTGFFEE